MDRFIRIFFLAFFILAISASPLLAALDGPSQAVPEIDPSLAPSAIALLTGGLLILKSKSTRK